MNKIFQYFGLAMAILGSVSAIQGVIAAHKLGAPFSGVALAAAVEPAEDALASILPHAAVPEALVLSICNAVADVLERYFQHAPVAVAGPAVQVAVRA